jgi:hypothetical protein
MNAVDARGRDGLGQGLANEAPGAELFHYCLARRRIFGLTKNRFTIYTFS